MSHTQQCVSPEECVCEAAGVRYWPGQQIKIDCEICVCERGRTQRCQPNPDCSGESVKHFRYAVNLPYQSLSLPIQSVFCNRSALWLVVMD